MSNRDKKIIASLLSAIAADDRLSVVTYGVKLYELHPGIKDEMENTALEWWGVPRMPER